MTKQSEKNAHEEMAAEIKKQETEKAMARLPEFKSLDLTDDPEQVKSLITAIENQASKEIVNAVSAIDGQRYVMVGRCFIHLKSICDHGEYKKGIEELGYKYDQVKKQIKFTESYINQALTRKKGTDALFGPGMAATMASYLSKDELKQLGDGETVYSLTDTAISKMTQREFVAHVKAAKAERDEAILERIKKDGQLSKSHDKNRTLEHEKSLIQDELDLLRKGPKSTEDAHKICSHLRSLATEMSVYIKKLKVLGHVPEVTNAGNDTIAWSILKLQIEFDLFSDVEPSDKKIKELEKLSALFGYPEEAD